MHAVLALAAIALGVAVFALLVALLLRHEYGPRAPARRRAVREPVREPAAVPSRPRRAAADPWHRRLPGLPSR